MFGALVWINPRVEQSDGAYNRDVTSREAPQIE